MFVRRHVLLSHLLFFLQILSNSQCASKSINESDIVNQCWSVVKALPIYNACTELYQQFSKYRKVDKCSASNLQARRYALCILRYYQFINQGKADQELIQRGYRRAPRNASAQKRLFILDLDGTLLDQRAMHRNPISMDPSQDQAHLVETLYDQIAHYFNADNLAFGLQKSLSRDCIHFDTIVYRPYTLEFIHRFREDSEFIIYSLAEPQNVIPHVIQLEMYYNLVFRLQPTRHRHSYGKTGDFRFLRVITGDSYSLRGNTLQSLQHKRGGVMYMKSLSIVQMVVNMHHFEAVHIVDDMPDIWTPDNPLSLYNYPRIFGHDAPEFVVEAYDPKWSVFIKQVMGMQRKDTYFRDLIRFVNVRENEGDFDGNGSSCTLSWKDTVESHRFVRVHGARVRSPLYSVKDIEPLPKNPFRMEKRKQSEQRRRERGRCVDCIIS